MLIVIKRGNETFEVEDRLALLPLRDVVLFPHVTSSLLVGRTASVNAVEEAVAGDRVVFVTAQKKPDITEPGADDLYRVGTVVRIVQLFRHPDGTIRVLVEGLGRARVRRFYWTSEYMSVRIEPIEEGAPAGNEVEALGRSVLNSFNDYVRLSRKLPDEVLLAINNTSDPCKLSYYVAGNLNVRVAVKQQILSTVDLEPRLNMLAKILTSELEIVKLERKIEGEVRSQVHRNQKEFYLNEQLKAIRKELGQGNEFSGEIEELAEQIKKAKMPKEAYEKAARELDRLGKMSFMAPEATVVRNYIDWLVALPWSVRTKDNLDMDVVERILDEDHYGLRKVKDRILEYLAVLKLSGAIKGPILCLVGPPGVGKTSLGRSIARALDRKFIRVSLGGVRDEAEIRGHRRTYIGSLPGRIIQSIRRAGSRNPVFLLDEVDKLGMDYRGDPAAALLEALDPEQNHAFSDHYLEVDFDLSEVMFITTANVLHTIPPALKDRMEVIRLPGYLDFEKAAIARQFLVRKQMEAAGLRAADVKLSDSALQKIITSYTREAGVRNLEREIGSVCRKVARSKAKGSGKQRKTVSVTSSNIHRYLGAPQFSDPLMPPVDRVGMATGLAWTEAGGELLTVEVSVLTGKGKLLLTGKLGEVMRESGQAALSYARANAETMGLDKDFYDKMDVHVHVLEGAVPKDGPSAGVTIAVALVSALTGVPTSKDVAMTGEITLRGNVLAVGGLNEKTVVAMRSGVKTVLIPKANDKDLSELPEIVKKNLNIETVETMDEVLELALVGWKPHTRPGKTDPSKTDSPDGVDADGMSTFC
jgi:ATP-dependent Lon protease